MVERSQQGKAHRRYLLGHREKYALGRKEKPSINIRRPDMERCERYEVGDFATRYKKRGVLNNVGTESMLQHGLYGRDGAIS